MRRVLEVRPDGSMVIEEVDTASRYAITMMGNTETSLRFYRDAFGLQVVGESENYGTEQEHLNNVFGARLRITTLRAAAGPAIEFLEYLTPRDGRPMPADTRANDLVNPMTPAFEAT